MLSELFEEILDSEKSFKEKVDRLRALTDDVEKCQKELDAVGVELELLQGEVLVKSQRLSELKVEVCSHNAVLGVLREQERALQEEKEGLEAQLAAAGEEVDRESEAFLAKAASFSNKFSLGSDTRRVNEECLMHEAASLQEEIALLQAELAESEAQEVGVSQLHAALEKAREDLLKVEKEAEEATVQARASQEELLAAEREYECLLQWSTSDPEFVRLQAELGQHRQGGLEEVCGRLRKELEAVQEEYYAQRWRRTQGGGGSGSHLGGGDREHSQMHRHGVQRQCVSGRRDCDNSLSSNPVEDSADLTAAKEGVWSVPLSGQGSTSCTPPNVMGGAETFSRVLSPWQQATHSSHQSSHSKHIAKTGPFGGSWKRPSGAVPATKDFTPAAVCMSGLLPMAGVKKVRFQY